MMDLGSARPAGPAAVVVANGEFVHPEWLLRLVDEADIVIAADGGANWLASLGRVPDVLVGDMDSVAPAVLRALEEGRCRLARHRRDKDKTDTELALTEACSLGAKRITILGALGGRIDHALANVLLLAMPQLEGVQTVIFDGRSTLWVVRGAGAIRGVVGDLVSLIPLAGDAEGVKTQGLAYPLHNETLRFALARGISNVLNEPVGRVSLQRGMLLVVHTPKDFMEEQDR
jgi:thiamine pyrophosphokinase